jgi:hypothetical protein
MALREWKKVIFSSQKVVKERGISQLLSQFEQ